MNKNSKLVYSTEMGRVKDPNESRKQRNQGEMPDNVRVRRESKGRKGKTVTVVTGLPMNDAGLKECAANLKKKLGTGGAIKDGVIEIQGDRVNDILALLEKQGIKAKRSGG